MIVDQKTTRASISMHSQSCQWTQEVMLGEQDGEKLESVGPSKGLMTRSQRTSLQSRTRSRGHGIAIAMFQRRYLGTCWRANWVSDSMLEWVVMHTNNVVVSSVSPHQLPPWVSKTTRTYSLSCSPLTLLPPCSAYPPYPAM